MLHSPLGILYFTLATRVVTPVQSRTSLDRRWIETGHCCITDLTESFSSYHENPHKLVRDPSPKSSGSHRFHSDEPANVFMLKLSARWQFANTIKKSADLVELSRV